VTSVFVLVGVRMYRDGLTQWLGDVPCIAVAGTARTVAEALPRLRATRPEVVLLDVGLEGGRTAAREIHAAAPGTRVIALAVAGTTAEVISCAEAGFSAYVTRDGTLADLVDTIGRAARGEVLCPPDVTASLFERLAALAPPTPAWQPAPAPLTAREVQIVRLLDRGLSNKEIARALCIALPTVKNHVHNVLHKLQVPRRADAAAYLGRAFAPGSGPRARTVDHPGPDPS
jgi:DNA-binding NarL/FixJ family response regulator